LNKNEYVTKLSKYDQKMLAQYKKTKEEIATKEKELKAEKKELDAYKAETETEKNKVAGMVKNTSSNISNYSSQINAAESQADAYEALGKQQDANISALQKQLEKEIAMSRLAAQSAKRDISQVTFVDGDREMLAELIYCEAGGEPYAGKLAVGAVVINRVLSSVYPDSVVGVIYQNRQFTPVGSGRLALALAEQRATNSCYQAADEAMSGASNVGNCVYFRTPLPGLEGISIGGHVFY